MAWNGRRPRHVLVLRDSLDKDTVMPFVRLVTWLAKEKQMDVFVEYADKSDSGLVQIEDFTPLRSCVTPFFKDRTEMCDRIDLIICIGGDGVLLHASSLFQTGVPPVMSFSLDTPGFLSPYTFDDQFKTHITTAMEGSPSVQKLCRLRCALMSGDEMSLSNDTKSNGCVKSYKLVLNDIVINRGNSPFLSQFKIYIDNRLVTLVQGDGIILSTATGSTAYAMSAGASIVHPEVPCVLLTPICPHSLSFRPIIVPAGVQIKVIVATVNNTAMVSFDGRHKVEMTHRDILLVTTGSYPVPSICPKDKMDDWFDNLALCLHWNVRKPQKSLEVANTFHPSLPTATSLNS